MRSTARGMGPFMMLGKRPGTDPTCQPPPLGPRPNLVGFPRRQIMIDQTTSTGETTDRTTLMPWRYR